MILHRAGSVHPAHPWTGVAALIAYTCKLGGTLGVGGALRPAFNVGVALEAGQAGAGCRASAVRALRVYAARRGSAGVPDVRDRCGGYTKRAQFKLSKTYF
jgi:hypothetical protein